MAFVLSEMLGLVLKKEFFKNVAIFSFDTSSHGVIGALVSRNMAGDGIEEGPLKAPLDLHETAAMVTIWLSVITAVSRLVVLYFKPNQCWTNWVFILLFTALAYSVKITG